MRRSRSSRYIDALIDMSERVVRLDTVAFAVSLFVCLIYGFMGNKLGYYSY